MGLIAPLPDSKTNNYSETTKFHQDLEIIGLEIERNEINGNYFPFGKL